MWIQNSEVRVGLGWGRKNTLKKHDGAIIYIAVHIVVLFWCNPLLFTLLNNRALPSERPVVLNPSDSAKVYPNNRREGDSFLCFNLRLCFLCGARLCEGPIPRQGNANRCL